MNTGDGRYPNTRYWRWHTDGSGKWHTGPPPGEELAALRRGLGREPGAVPKMWHFYTTLTEDGRRTVELRAEHLVLTLFAVHQQSRPRPMHREGRDFQIGSAVRALCDSEKFSQDAVNRRFAAAATATSANELGMHLRGLVTQLRVIDQPVDYDSLFRDVRDYHYPDRIPAVRRRWGARYFARTPTTDEASADDAPDATATSD